MIKGYKKVEVDVDCKPFQHELSYVTDREDYVQCNKCFRHWKLMDNEEYLPSRSMRGDELRKLRRHYI